MLPDQSKDVMNFDRSRRPFAIRGQGATAGLSSSAESFGASTALLDKPAVAPKRDPLNAFPMPRKGRHCGCILWILLVWVSASGASCPRLLQQYTQPIPRALPPGATLTQIINVVNDNSARVQSVSTSRATLVTPGAPSLNAQITFQRPRSFRLRAEKFIGTEVDLGSNDELLWFWIKHAQPPALFFCRHDQFATSAARQIIPVEPEWLIEALGVVTFDPTAQHMGPTPVGAGRLEILTKPTTPGKGFSRITIINDSLGVVLEQHVYDPQGIRLASAVLSRHVRDPATGVTLPRHVEIQFPPAQREFSIDMAELQINGLTPDQAAQFFVKPSYSGYNEIDLAQPNGPATPAANGPYKVPATVRY
jgi:hypothetical protein